MQGMHNLLIGNFGLLAVRSILPVVKRIRDTCFSLLSPVNTKYLQALASEH